MWESFMFSMFSMFEFNTTVHYRCVLYSIASTNKIRFLTSLSSCACSECSPQLTSNTSCPFARAQVRIAKSRLRKQLFGESLRPSYTQNDPFADLLFRGPTGGSASGMVGTTQAQSEAILARKSKVHTRTGENNLHAIVQCIASKLRLKSAQKWFRVKLHIHSCWTWRWRRRVSVWTNACGSSAREWTSSTAWAARAQCSTGPRRRREVQVISADPPTTMALNMAHNRRLPTPRDLSRSVRRPRASKGQRTWRPPPQRSLLSFEGWLADWSDGVTCIYYLIIEWLTFNSSAIMVAIVIILYLQTFLNKNFSNNNFL